MKKIINATLINITLSQSAVKKKGIPANEAIVVVTPSG
jgi:hypothetical protein